MEPQTIMNYITAMAVFSAAAYVGAVLFQVVRLVVRSILLSYAPKQKITVRIKNIDGEVEFKTLKADEPEEVINTIIKSYNDNSRKENFSS